MSASSAEAKKNQPQITLEVSQEQALQLKNALEIAKALAAPPRLAIFGLLARQPDKALSLIEIAELTGLTQHEAQKNTKILAQFGLIRVEEWFDEFPFQVIFEPEYLKTVPQVIAALQHLNSQLQPAEQQPALDERAKTIGRFMKEGRLVDWPSQFKRQVYVMEEIAKVFQPGLRYTERQVDAILKEIYHDHCTLRRSLVDLKLLQRADGMYWKDSPGLAAV